MNYSEFVKSRAKVLESDLQDILHAAVGASGEAGELLDCVKKAWIYNKPLDIANLKEETGDILFYVQMICNKQGWTIQELHRANMEKLNKRYPLGYSDKAAQERADKA